MAQLWRSLRWLRSPLTLGSVLSVAIGVGVNGAEFSLLKHVLIPSLPFTKADDILFISEKHRAQSVGEFYCSPGFYLALKQRAKSLSTVSAYVRVDTDWPLTGVLHPQRVKGLAATVDLVPLLGITRPATGRLFTPTDALPGAPHVALLSYPFWQRAFGGSQQVLGSTIRLAGVSYEVVGVLPPAAQHFPDAGDVWTVWAPTADAASEFGALFLGVVARRRPGAVALTPANELAAVHADVVAKTPFMREWVATASSFGDRVGARLRQPLLLLGMATIGLLVICCLNTANLLSAYWHARARELAIRVACGASRARVVAEVVTNVVFCFGVGGTLSLVAARWVLSATAASLPEGALGPVAPVLDWTAMAFMAIVTAIAACITGIATALVVTRESSTTDLLRPESGSAGRLARWRRATVIAQVTLAVVFVSGTLTLIDNIRVLSKPLRGLEADDVLTMRVLSSDECRRCRELSPGVTFQEVLVPLLKGIPTVNAVGVISSLPVRDDGPRIEMAAEGGDPTLRWMPLVTVASSETFAAIGLNSLAGRLYDGRDTRTSPPVAVVSESMAKRVWPGKVPVEKRLRLNPRSPDQPWITVIGVVPDLVSSSLGTASMTMYLPYEQTRWNSATTIVVRKRGNAADLLPAVSKTIASYDHGLTVSDVAILEEVLSRNVASRKTVLTLVAGFTAVAGALMAVGMYGLSSGLARLQRRAIAIRCALGATHRDETLRLLGVMLWDLGRAAVWGCLLCIPASLVARQLSADLGVNPGMVLVAVTVVIAVGIAGTLIPIWRALRVNLVTLLKDAV